MDILPLVSAAAAVIAGLGTLLSGIGRWRTTNKERPKDGDSFAYQTKSAVTTINETLAATAADRDHWRERALEAERKLDESGSDE
jgi:hypothetical protein